MNLTCNSTLDDLRILPTSEVKIAGDLTFHSLAEVIAGACTIIAILMSFYLIWMHALHYTKPAEQRQIIRILFMVPIYAVASFLSLHYYWHAIYFEVISDCYEAFAISSFFALMCSYIDVDLHEQKNFFRQMRPVKPWVWPVNWFKKCCGGERGPWRTPYSGLTWFNIIWIGIYHYCFIRVTMTITSVVTQYFGRYCESSDSPVFAHIWVLVIESVAVSIAMYCVIQFYVQLRTALADHQPFLKVLAIKLVIFLSFWQSTVISLGTSFNIVHTTSWIAYPDIKVGIPSLLLCFEMACFSFLHLFAFPYRPYLDTAPATFYPVPDADAPYAMPKPNAHSPRSGGFMGFRAIVDAMNIWDVAKAFGRGIRWLFVGVKHRREDVSYQTPQKSSELNLNELSPESSNVNKPGAVGVMAGEVDTAYHPGLATMKSTEHLPIATEFRRSRFDTLQDGSVGIGRAGVTRADGSSSSADAGASGSGRRQPSDEAAGLIAYAQPMSVQGSDGSPERYRDGRDGREVQQGVTGEAPYTVYNEDYAQAGAGADAGRGYNQYGQAYSQEYGQTYAYSQAYSQGGYAPQAYEQRGRSQEDYGRGTSQPHSPAAGSPAGGRRYGDAR